MCQSWRGIKIHVELEYLRLEFHKTKPKEKKNQKPYRKFLLLSSRSSPNQASKTKAHHRGSLLILLPIFLGQNPRSKPMNFLPLFLGSNRDEFIGFRFAFYDQDEVVVHLLCLVLQVPIRAFVGFVFGFTGEMFM